MTPSGVAFPVSLHAPVCVCVPREKLLLSTVLTELWNPLALPIVHGAASVLLFTLSTRTPRADLVLTSCDSVGSKSAVS